MKNKKQLILLSIILCISLLGCDGCDSTKVADATMFQLSCAVFWGSLFANLLKW